jgi:hypothetical protein
MAQAMKERRVATTAAAKARAATDDKAGAGETPEVAQGERTAPDIDPRQVTLDAQGQSLRRWFVRLPEGFVAGDLAETEVWRRVQADVGKALRRHDHVYLVAFDESWAAESVVTDANAREASLAKPRIVSMESRIKPLFNDGTYHVAWRGNGYAVVRNGDSHVMTQPVASEALATRELAMLYERRV